ncbi:ABC transporter substrate-binding [Pyrenophora seminiperda CCB06]|uniref:ABC transporter substrate-binding n=1 Tax=Pyrenophora seminiperda CCB06 TaxID=1302712 RepID=A0A3M7M4W7_9PLEO|nr:ABC transporter substrate-binding [Pyrenophora seminiperda CCB06]
MAKEATNKAVPNPTNPSALKPRYEIRKLKPEHIPWALAVLIHSHAFRHHVWGPNWPDRMMGKWALEMVPTLSYLVEHQVNSGLSHGVFDTEYTFKTPEAQKLGGKLYWDVNEDPSASVEKSQGTEAEGNRLLQQMDFPLVSIALSYDGFYPLDHHKMQPILRAWPEFTALYGILEKRDPRAPEDWKPTAPGQVLMRNATSTRQGYEGEGIMSATARWLQREAAAMGFRGIQIEAVADPVTHVWSDGAQPPFKGMVVSEFDTETVDDEEGRKLLGKAKQRITKCWVDLTAV